jgi:polygalacturonase
MTRSKTFLFFFVTLVLCLRLPAEGGRPAEPVLEVGLNSHAVQIGGLSNDVVSVVAGSTYMFSPDTPEDRGLVSTTPDVKELLRQVSSKDETVRTLRVLDRDGRDKTEGKVETGDSLVMVGPDGVVKKTYRLQTKPLALGGRLQLEHDTLTVNTKKDVTLYFTAGQRSPDATVRLYLPVGVKASPDTITVNVIGRGDVKLKDLPSQSIGRVGTKYSYSKVGMASIEKSPDGGLDVIMSHLDLRPANGADLKIVIGGVEFSKVGAYSFKAIYTTSQPEVLTSAGIGEDVATLQVVPTISDFSRVIDRSLEYKETPTMYTSAQFKWTWEKPAAPVKLMHSEDEGKTWAAIDAAIDSKNATARVDGLQPNRMHAFRLAVGTGKSEAMSNVARFYSGKMDIKSFGATGEGTADDTDKVNAAIAQLAGIGGGTLLFSDGAYAVRTVHLQSNVYLYLTAGATIKALKGGDAPESTWFSDRRYRAGLSPTDIGPYVDPENWLTKQDVGHHYFRNTMFFGERLDNVKIVGNGRITGNGNLNTSDSVMKNAPDNRSDKMFTLKLCTNLEIGGIRREDDLWYDPEKDEPYYIKKDGSKDFEIGNMLSIDRSGHFVLLATGTDGINIHDMYVAKQVTGTVRDVYDFMACNDVTVTNIYSKLSSDDIVKPGSDCSLGFTRPAKGYRVRNIIGDTNCNLFQIGSETADDITDLYVDNIYVLGANKAGFSISTNDGGHVKNVFLNSGQTGPLHSRSKIMRAHTPFFISISNRGRVLGATVHRYKFKDNGKAHDELLNTNVDIGVVQNIVLNGVDVTEIYAGSAFGNDRKKPAAAAEDDGGEGGGAPAANPARGSRWKAYTSQRKAAPIVAGYKLPDSAEVEGGLDFKLPNGKHTGYVQDVQFNDVHILVKGGNPQSDSDNQPQELGVGQYNASNLGVLPGYGFYGRHVAGLTLNNCTFNYEKRDSTYPIFLDDVNGAKLRGVKMVRAKDAADAIKQKDCRDVVVESATVYDDVWGAAPVELK